MYVSISTSAQAGGAQPHAHRPDPDPNPDLNPNPNPNPDPNPNPNQVGSYALMGSSGFKHLDFLNCCKFAEGDSRVLMQKMVRLA